MTSLEIYAISSFLLPMGSVGGLGLSEGLLSLLKFIITLLHTSAQIQRNWFRLSWLTTIVAIGLWKPYAKSKSGMNLVMYDVY
jgi:hypothetical protein